MLLMTGETAVQQPPGSPGAGLLAGARECSRAVSVLAHHSAGVGAIAILAAHAVELALKAFLRQGGWSDDQLRPMGHNLLDTWSAADEAGLALGAVPSWVKILDRIHHQPFAGRYPTAHGEVATPHPSQLGFHLTELIEKVARTWHAP